MKTTTQQKGIVLVALACSCEQCNGSLRTDNQVLIHSKAGQGTSSLSSAAIKVVLFRLAFVV